MAKKGSQTLVFALAFFTWILLTWKLEGASIITGLFISFIAALLFGETLTVNPQKGLNPGRYFWALLYMPLFLWEMIKANIDVACRVLHPGLPIRPGIVKIKTQLKSEVSKTVLANSITLTPGTMTIDLINDELFIHWIYVKEKESDKISEKFEKIIARIFE